MFVFNNKVQHMFILFFFVDVVVDKVQPMVGWTCHCIAPSNYTDRFDFKSSISLFFGT